jgi:hypothetical protein
MSIKTKVKKTGEFFLATTYLGAIKDRIRDAHSPVDPNTYYVGLHFPESAVGGSHYVEFTEAKSATFRGVDLEEDDSDLLLVPFP